MKKLFSFALSFAAVMAIVSCEPKTPAPGPDPEPDPEKPAEYVPDNGVIMHNVTFKTDLLGGDNAKYTIYMPVKDWETTDKKFPVMYLLHGMWSYCDEWSEKGNVQNITFKFKKNKTAGDFIIVMPQAWDSFYVDGWDSSTGTYRQVETFFWTELKPYIEANYPVLTGRSNTMIAGLSMGGFGASYYAFKYPDQFCMCYEMSGAVEGGGRADTPSVKKMFQNWGYDKEGFDFNTLPVYFMDCGDQDSMCHNANVNTDKYLTQIGFPHTYRHYDGVHDWAYWKGCYERMMYDLPDAFKYQGN